MGTPREVEDFETQLAAEQNTRNSYISAEVVRAFNEMTAVLKEIKEELTLIRHAPEIRAEKIVRDNKHIEDLTRLLEEQKEERKNDNH